jgi:hypothetical protein
MIRQYFDSINNYKIKAIEYDKIIQTQQDNEKLLYKHIELKKEYSISEKQILTLQKEIDKLKNDYSELEQEYKLLKIENKFLKSK